MPLYVRAVCIQVGGLPAVVAEDWAAWGETFSQSDPPGQTCSAGAGDPAGRRHGGCLWPTFSGCSGASAHSCIVNEQRGSGYWRVRGS